MFKLMILIGPKRYKTVLARTEKAILIRYRAAAKNRKYRSAYVMNQSNQVLCSF